MLIRPNIPEEPGSPLLRLIASKGVIHTVIDERTGLDRQRAVPGLTEAQYMNAIDLLVDSAQSHHRDIQELKDVIDRLANNAVE